MSKASIINILKKLNITNKKINNHIVCKDINKIIDECTFFANNLNFDIDESSFCVNQKVNYEYSKKCVK